MELGVLIYLDNLILNHESGLPEPNSRSGINTLQMMGFVIIGRSQHSNRSNHLRQKNLEFHLNSQTMALFLLDNK